MRTRGSISSLRSAGTTRVLPARWALPNGSALALVFSLASGIVSCDSEPYLIGLDEPIIAQNAELKRGDLPEESQDSARVTSLELGFGVLKPGAVNATVRGRTTDDAYAIAIRFEDLGSGYWVKPVGAPDPTLPDELTFDLTFQAAYDITPGYHDLVAVAFDSKGHAGPAYTVPVCVASDLPDNQNACNPKNEPPPAIISLTWDADSDLDLVIEGPGGVRYDRSHRSEFDGETMLWGLDIDGSVACLVDGRRRENFVFYELPEEGSTFLAYASFFDACGRSAVRFELTVYRAQREAGGNWSLVAEPPVRSEYVRAQQSGGVATPLYLRAVEF
jgi:hypothetical protein